MHKYICAIALLGFSIAGACAETIDLGRGPVNLRVPEGYSAESPAPLIVLLHGYTSSGNGQEAYMKFGKIADEYGFLFVNPDGTKEDSDRANRFWNATSACCNFHGSEVDDSAYLRSIIDHVKSEYAVDENRVYLVGHSNGGFMSYRMAHDHGDAIAAIASLAGASLQSLENAPESTPVSVLQIHGTEDKTIQYEGGDIGNQAYPSAVGSAQQWAAHNGCEVTSAVIDEKLDLDKRVDGDETIITQFRSGCEKAGSVELWTIEGGGHIPALTDNFARSVVEWLYAHPKAGHGTDTD